MTWSPARRVFRFGADGRQVERDIQRELEFHLAIRIEHLMAAGIDPTTAKARALERFGDIGDINIQCQEIGMQRIRDERRASWWQDLRQDMKYAVRTLNRQRTFALVIVLILALGIGANTATFTLINTLLLRPLPVPHPGELVVIGDPSLVGVTSQGSPSAEVFSYPLYRDLRDADPRLGTMIASGRAGRIDVVVDTAGNSGAPENAEHPSVRFVSENYFRGLQVTPSLGQDFPADAGRSPGDAPLVMISHHWWQQHFASDRRAVGRVILLNRTPLRIAGVTPPGFSGEAVGAPTDLWVPISMQGLLMPHRPLIEDRSTSWMQVMLRRAPGVTLAQLAARLDPAMRRSIGANLGGEGPGFVERMDSLQVHEGARGVSYERGQAGTPLMLLMGAVGLVLLVVCANVANLMLARATARRRELSVRIAIGAGRFRLVRQLFTEGLILALAGGSLGVGLAVVATRILLRPTGPTNGPPPDLRPDWRILIFALGVTLLTAVVSSLLPALRATRINLATVLRSSGRSVSGSRRPGWWLVIVQVALSLVLLSGTGMLLRSLRQLETVDIGMARDRLVVARVDLARGGYQGERRAALARDLVARLEQVDGVTGVSFSGNGLFNGSESRSTMGIEGFVAQTAEDSAMYFDNVGPGYATTLGARILQGRDIATSDLPGSARAVLVNRTFAERYFTGESALGRRVLTDTIAWNIVGVIGDVQDHDLRNPPTPRVYFSGLQRAQLDDQLVLISHGSGDPAVLALAVRKALQQADPSLAILSVDPVMARIRSRLTGERMMANSLTGFGVLTLILAAMGLYGVMAYSTLRRTSEFGVRLALGATAPDVTRLVLREAFLLLIGGMALGLPLALGGAHLLRNMLFGVAPWDPLSLGIAFVALAASTALAAWLPARRAARVGPLTALRAE